MVFGAGECRRCRLGLVAEIMLSLLLFIRLRASCCHWLTSSPMGPRGVAFDFEHFHESEYSLKLLYSRK